MLFPVRVLASVATLPCESVFLNENHCGVTFSPVCPAPVPTLPKVKDKVKVLVWFAGMLTLRPENKIEFEAGRVCTQTPSTLRQTCVKVVGRSPASPHVL